MTDNRWQAGLYGNYTDERDEQVRHIIEAIQTEQNCGQSEAIKRAILNAYAHSKEPEPIQDLCAYAPEVDLSGVHMRLDYISEQVASVSNEIRRLQAAPRDSVVQVVTDGNTGEQREIIADVVPIDPNDNTPFLRGVRNVAKPGRRLE